MSPTCPITTEPGTNLSETWRLIRKMRNEFCKVWSADYLNSLQQRYKWKIEKGNLCSGDLEIIKEENINPSKWLLAKVQEVQQAPDGRVRVATLQRSDGNLFKRSLCKLILLPREEIPKEKIEKAIGPVNNLGQARRSRSNMDILS